MADHIRIANTLDHPVYAIAVPKKEFLIADLTFAAATTLAGGVGSGMALGSLIKVKDIAMIARLSRMLTVATTGAGMLSDRVRSMNASGAIRVDPGQIVEVYSYNKRDPLNYLSPSGWFNLGRAETISLTVIDPGGAAPRAVECSCGTDYGFLVEERGVRRSVGGSWWTASGDLRIWNAAALETPFVSNKAPTVIAWNGGLHLYYKDGNSTALLHGELGDSTWRQSSPATTGLETSSGPNVIEYQGKLYCFYRHAAGSGLQCATSSDGYTFTPLASSALGFGIDGRPASAVLGSKLCVVATEHSGTRMHYVTFDGSSWQRGLTVDWSSGAPALVAFGGKFHLFFKDQSGRALMHAISSDGASWAHADPFMIGFDTSSGPGAVVVDGKIVLFFRDPGGNGTFYTRSSDGFHFDACSECYFGLDLDLNPAVGVYGGQLQVLGKSTTPVVPFSFDDDGNGSDGIVQRAAITWSMLDTASIIGSTPPAPTSSVWLSTVEALQGKTSLWVPGYGVRYAVGYEFPDGTVNRGPWWQGDPNNNGYYGWMYAYPTLTNIGRDPEERAVARRIYRQFNGQPEQLIARIPNNSDSTYVDNDPGVPSPVLGVWTLNIPVAGSESWTLGHLVCYAVAFEHSDGTIHVGPWSNPPAADWPYAAPTLNLPCDPTGKTVARRIYRKFRDENGRMIARIANNTDTTYVDADRGAPSPPKMDIWMANTPVADSTRWVDGYGVRYATAFEYPGGEVVRGPWSNPNFADGYFGWGYSLPKLKDIPTDGSGRAVARLVYRQFRGFPDELIARIPNNTATTHDDSDRGPPAAPSLATWAANLPITGSGVWVSGCRVRYAVAYEFADGHESRSPWWSSAETLGAADADGFVSTGYALASLSGIARDPSSRAVARRIYRQFDGWGEQLLGRIANNTDTTFVDSDKGPPASEYAVPARNGSYDWNCSWQLSEAGYGAVKFVAKADEDVYIAISASAANRDPMYEIIIGGWGNAKSVIRRASGGAAVATAQVGVASPGGKNPLWVSIDRTTSCIQVGRGAVGQDVFLSYFDPAFLADARHVSLSSWDKPIQYTSIATSAPPLSAYAIPARNGSYDWSRSWQLPEAGRGAVKFVAKAEEDVYVAISASAANRDPMYEIIIGGWGNAKSVIRRVSGGAAVATAQMGVASPGGENPLWVSIDRTTSRIQVGRGAVGEGVFLSFVDPAFLADARHVALSSWDKPIQYTSIATSLPPSAPLSTYAVSARNGSYDWSQSWQLPEAGRGAVSFVARADEDVYVAISANTANRDPMYEIIVGGWGNTKSVIRRASGGAAVATAQVGVTSPGGDNSLWVSIDRTTSRIQVGRGAVGQSVFLSFVDPAFLTDARHITLSSWDKPIQYTSITTSAPPAGT